jgi:hypothetical protein
MLCAGAHARAHSLLDRLNPGRIVEERHVLLPGQADQYVQSVLLGQVEKPARRSSVGANRVYAVRGHRGEVFGDGLEPGKVVRLLVGAEGPVRDAAHVELLVAQVDGLPPDRRACADRGASCRVHPARFANSMPLEIKNPCVPPANPSRIGPEPNSEKGLLG